MLASQGVQDDVVFGCSNIPTIIFGEPPSAAHINRSRLQKNSARDTCSKSWTPQATVYLTWYEDNRLPKQLLPELTLHRLVRLQSVHHDVYSGVKGQRPLGYYCTSAHLHNTMRCSTWRCAPHAFAHTHKVS